MRNFRQFLKEEDGPTTVEYASMLALIVLVAVAGIWALGTSVSSVFENISEMAGYDIAG